MVSKGKGLNERRQKLLAFTQDYQRKNKRSPSTGEIAQNCGVNSTQVVRYYLDQLDRGGHIDRDHRRPE